MRKMIYGLLIVVSVIFIGACGNKENKEAEVQSDIDLTGLSGTMLYSAIYDIMMEPEDYLGKTIKIEGQFTVFPDEQSDENRYAVIIADASACCEQGIMFTLAGEHTYPDDYPEPEDDITVVGEFKLYNEGEYFYYYLGESEILPERSSNLN